MVPLRRLKKRLTLQKDKMTLEKIGFKKEARTGI
jgi:hypothetical protein